MRTRSSWMWMALMRLLSGKSGSSVNALPLGSTRIARETALLDVVFSALVVDADAVFDTTAAIAVGGSVTLMFRAALAPVVNVPMAAVTVPPATEQVPADTVQKLKVTP